MKAIQLEALSPEESISITVQGKNPDDYTALNIVAMGLELQPQTAKVKESEDSEIRHNCIIAVIPFPLPLDKKILQQNQLIVPNMQQGSPIQKVLGDIPRVRLIIQKDALVETIK